MKTMTSRYIADTYAWIAYFTNKRFQGIVEENVIETPTIVLAELVRVLKRRKVSDPEIEKTLAFVSGRGLILPLDAETAKRGGKISNDAGLPLIDSVIYAYCDSEDCKLLTGDEHLKNMKNVIFEKE